MRLRDRIENFFTREDTDPNDLSFSNADLLPVANAGPANDRFELVFRANRSLANMIAALEGTRYKADMSARGKSALMLSSLESVSFDGLVDDGYYKNLEAARKGISGELRSKLGFGVLTLSYHWKMESGAATFYVYQHYDPGTMPEHIQRALAPFESPIQPHPHRVAAPKASDVRSKAFPITRRVTPRQDGQFGEVCERVTEELLQNVGPQNKRPAVYFEGISRAA